MAYLDLSTYRDTLSILPGDYVDDVETRFPGWVAAQLEYWSAHIDARLQKRYAVPFSSPYPHAVTGWLARLLDVRVLLKRGVDATDEQFATVEKSAADALAELREAADAVAGLFDLPLRADLPGSGITKPRPGGYSEASPYTWSQLQRTRAEGE